MTNYVVRTVMPIKADDPISAVEQYITQLRASNPEDLVYRAEEDDETMQYVYRGRVWGLDELVEMLEEASREVNDDEL